MVGSATHLNFAGVNLSECYSLNIKRMTYKQIIIPLFAACTLFASLHMKAKDMGMPFEQGAVWSYYTAYNFEYSPLRYKADGEKVINNRVYTAIYQFDGCEYTASEAKLAGCIRQEGSKIYMAADVGEECQFVAMDAKEENGEYLLYDFALKEGDRIGQSNILVTEVSSLTNVQGETLKTITLENGIVGV